MKKQPAIHSRGEPLVARFFQLLHVILRTISRIYRVIFRLTAKSQLSEEMERYLQNLTPSAMIRPDPDGLSSEDIKQLKIMIKTAKTERRL